MNPRTELALLGEAYEVSQRKVERLKAANEGLLIEKRQEKAGRLSAQATVADLEERIEQAVKILADPEKPSAQGNVQARLILAGKGPIRLLPDGETDE